MYDSLVVSGLGIAVLGVMLAISRRTKSQWIGLLACAWAVLVCWRLSYVIARANTRLLAQGPPEGSQLLLAATGTAAVVLFAWLGLRHLWPCGGILGFPRRGAALSAIIGVAVGAVLATMQFPQVWSRLGEIPTDVWPSFLALSFVPLSVLEECVYRGRLMETLRHQFRSVEAVLVVQAVIFVIPHLRSVSFWADLRGRPSALAGIVAELLVFGYACGLLREKRGNLWAPAAAHVTFNLLWFAQMMTLSYREFFGR